MRVGPVAERRTCMSLRKRYKILRMIVLALTALAVIGALMRLKWVILLAALLLIPWVALELRWWRCPKCGAFLGRMEKKNNCPQCGEKLDLR